MRSIHSPKVFTKPMIERYQRHLQAYRQANGQPLAYSSQGVYLRAVKGWFRWLTQENYLASNLACDVVMLRVPKRLPSGVLSIEEIIQILTRIDVNEVEGMRDRALLELLYSTGIRRSEVCRLLVGDMDLHKHTLFVRQGKGKKDRHVPVGEPALDWVNRYLTEARSALMANLTEQTLFITGYGEPLTPSYLSHRVKRRLMEAEITREGGCHLFRHAMATHMLDNGAELRYIQAILGHSDINTTTVYTHLSLEALKKVHAKTHPR